MNEHLITACLWLAILLAWAAATALYWRRRVRQLSEYVRDCERQAARAQDAEREATRLATGYRQQMRQHGLIVVRKSDNQEVWLRGQVWVDGPEDPQ